MKIKRKTESAFWDTEDKTFGITAGVLTHWMLLPVPPAQEQR